MSGRSDSCRDINVADLLEADQDTDRFRSAARHVDLCPECQRRLEQLAAGADYWTTLRDMLRPQEGDLPDSGLISRYHSAGSVLWRPSEADEATVKELLGTPSHPEMLGRLGRYEIERIIGTGGMGIVLKAFDSELNRPVAIKLLAPHLARVGPARQRFAREARAAAAVVHEHVVPIHNVESDQTIPFLVMQFIPGESLQTRVERDGPLSVREILRIGMQAASGLAAAHAQGLVHRDVKPANILLENGVERAYLTDFGLARAADDASLTCTGAVAGTPYYMSPEQADNRPLDHRTDLFSLGSVLYFMATGHPPFRADRTMAVLKRTCHDPHRPVWEYNAEIPDGLSAIIDRLLAKDPSRRFASAGQLQQALAKVLAGVQQGKLGRSCRRSRRHVTRWLVALIVVAAVAAGIPLTARFLDQGDHAELTSTTQQTAERKQPDSGMESPESLLHELYSLDPSPASQSQRELDELSSVLDALETFPYPELHSQESHRETQ